MTKAKPAKPGGTRGGVTVSKVATGYLTAPQLGAQILAPRVETLSRFRRKHRPGAYLDFAQVYEEFSADTATPNLLIFGRRGTGKSTAVRWHLHRQAMTYPGFQYMVCRLSKPDLQRTHLVHLEADMTALGGEWLSIRGESRYPNGSLGYWTGFEKEKDALKVLGMDLDALVVEEGTTMPWAIIVDLSATLRSTLATGRTPQLIIPTNPFGPHAAAIKRRFIDQDLSEDEEPGYDPAEWRAIVTTAGDNPALNFQAYDKRLGGLAGPKRRAWLLGEWALGTGAFFDFHPEMDGRPWHVIPRLPEVYGKSVYRNPGIPVVRVVDYGYSEDPAVCLWIAVLPNGRGIVVKEKQWVRTPAAEMAREVLGHSAELRCTETFADPTLWHGERAGAESVAARFAAAGLALTPSVNDRTMHALHEWLALTLEDGKPKLQFWAEGCPELIRRLPMMVGNAHRPEYMADARDDYVCALHYFCLGGVKGREQTPEKQIPWWMKPGAGSRLGAESVRRG